MNTTNRDDLSWPWLLLVVVLNSAVMWCGAVYLWRYGWPMRGLSLAMALLPIKWVIMCVHRRWRELNRDLFL